MWCTHDTFIVLSQLSLADPGGPGPPCPQDFFKIMQFSSNFKGRPTILSKFWAQPPTPRGQNSAAPGKNPLSVWYFSHGLRVNPYSAGHNVVAATASIPSKYQTIVTSRRERKGFHSRTKRFVNEDGVNNIHFTPLKFLAFFCHIFEKQERVKSYFALPLLSQLERKSWSWKLRYPRQHWKMFAVFLEKRNRRFGVKGNNSVSAPKTSRKTMCNLTLILSRIQCIDAVLQTLQRGFHFRHLHILTYLHRMRDTSSSRAV